MPLGPLRQAAPALALAGLVAAVLVCLPRERPYPQAGTHEIVDENGRRVRFAPGAQRALYMATGAGEYLLVTRRPKNLLTSRSPVNERLLASALLQRVLPDLQTVRLDLSSSEGAATNLEALLLQRPDLLITWSRLVPRFERVGIPVAGLGPVSTAAQLHDHARLFGAVTNEPQRSAGIVARSVAEQAALTRDVAMHVERKTRLLFLYPSGASWRVAFEFPDVVAAAAADDLGLPLGLSAGLDAERLLALAPEVIVIVGGQRIDDEAAMRLMANPAWASVPAVAQKRVYRHPPGLSGYMSSAIELPIYERWLAEVLHPDRLAPSARTSAAAIIESELGVRPSEDELDELLGVRTNRPSANNARFARTPG